MTDETERREFDFLSPATIEDPHPAFRDLLSRGNMLWSQRLRSWLVVGYEAARNVLASPDMAAVDAPGRLEATAKKSGRSFPSWLRMARHLPTFTNGANHARLRRGLGATLGAARDRFEPVSDAAARRLLEPLRRAGGGDLAAAFAHRLHGEVIGELMGVPAGDRPRLAHLADVGRTLDDAVPLREYASGETKIVELCDFMLDLLRQQRKRGETTLLSDLARRFEPDPTEDPDVSVATAAAALLVLGRDTVSGALTLALADLFDRHDGVLLPSALQMTAPQIDEIVRIGSSVQYAKREAIRDQLVDGQPVKGGEHMLILIAAADRDPQRFEEPTEVRPERAGFSLAFGHGVHSCLGAPMGRQEIASAFAALAELPRLRAGQGRRFGRSRLFRGYTYLPATFA